MNRKEVGAIVVFSKTPGYSPIKTRLAESIGQEYAEKFHRISVDILKTKLRGIAGLATYWAVAEEEALSAPTWSDVSTIRQGTGDLGSKLHHVYSSLLQHHDFVLMIGTDCPHLQLESISGSMTILSNWELNPSSGKFVMGRCQDGGFYLFGGDTPISGEIWNAVAYSQNTTGKDLAKKVSTLGTIQYLMESFDVDTIEDLLSLQRLCLSDDSLRRKFGDYFVEVFNKAHVKVEAEEVP